MGLLAGGQRMILRALTADVGRPVLYSRTVDGGTRSITFHAWPGRTIFSGLTEAGVSVQRSDRDYLFAAADLVLGGIPTTPMRGDRIEDDAGVFELASPQTDEPVWRYSDQFRTVIRVHVQRVA
jgi:hypothetical protein